MIRHFLYSLILTLFVSQAAIAAEEIAVVDMEEVLSRSVAIEKIQKEVKVKRKDFQENVQSKEEELRESKNKLAEQRSLLSKEAYDGKIREFQDQANAISRELQQQRIEYDKASSSAINEVKVAIAEIVNNLAKEKKFKLAIPSGVVLYYTETLDITDEVASRLNKNLPKVNTKLP